jgi:DNA mismatch endonuclease, patch repair protein
LFKDGSAGNSTSSLHGSGASARLVAGRLIPNATQSPEQTLTFSFGGRNFDLVRIRRFGRRKIGLPAARQATRIFMDRISKAQRSANMAAIKGKNTSPELIVRRALFKSGLRYRLHDRLLPGRPDIVFRGRRLVVFVHGCFWHGCTKCIDGTRAVKSNTAYWTNKRQGNRDRDERNRAKLKGLGWRIEEIWECEVEKTGIVDRLVKRVGRYKPA